MELLIGQIPEAIYFALFMIYAKGIKEKRILFIALMVVEYLLILQNIYFNTYSQVIYTIMVFITLKVLYKEKCQITDIFTFGIASLILIVISIISFFIFRPDMITGAIFNRFLLFLFLFLLKNKLIFIKNIYKRLWNRNDKVKNIMKSATFRSLNIIIFNFMFYIINLGMLYMLFLRK